MSTSVNSTANLEPASEPDPESQTRPIAAAETKALLPSVAILGFVLFATYAGLLSVLLPNHVAQLDEANKIANFGLVTTISLVFTIVAQPVIGAISDRTRTRWGRRTPWMVLGAGVGALFLLALPVFASIIWITICWVIIQVALNVLQNPLTAITPDRIVEARRGIASSVAGLGFMVGGVAGVMLAGALASNFGLGYGVFGIIVAVVTLAFVLINPDKSSAKLVLPPFSWAAFFKAFWVNPRKHPDFGWAFLARFFFILGYFTAFSYMLYTLTDYIGLDIDAANATVGILSLAGLVPTVVGIAVTGWLSDKLKRRKVFVYLASVFLAIGLSMPLFFPSVEGMIAMSVINGFGFGIYMSADTALMTLVLPDGGKDAGKDLGILNIATNIPQAMSPATAGIIIGVAGFPALFVFAIIAVIIAAFVIKPIKAVR
jgi:MFS family permease